MKLHGGLVLVWCVWVAADLGDGGQAHQYDAWEGSLAADMDNQRLPQGNRVAILLVGLFKPKVTDLVALPSLVKHVIEPVGQANVDVFVNSEAAQGTSTEAANASFALWVPSGSLKALVMRPRGVPPPQLLHDTKDDSEWLENAVLCRRHAQPRGLFVSQYERLRDLFGLVLGSEVKLGARYGHVVRMRTDTVWTRDWPSVTLERGLPVPPGHLGGPNFDSKGILLDHFFISSRAVAWASFYEAPVLFQRGWDREAVYRATGCHLVRHNEEAHTDCRKAIYGLNSVWPEAILTMFFRQHLVTHLVETCAFTGEFIVNSRNSPTLRPCDGVVATSAGEDVAIAEVEKYFEIEMWLPE